MNKKAKYILYLTSAVIIVTSIASFWAFAHAMRAETDVRYHSLQHLITGRLLKTLKDTETNAKNVFDEVGKNLDSPSAVIEALKSKTSLAPDVRGYFAAFTPKYFPEEGTWFEPYVHQTADSSDFVLTMVGSARHDYTRSDWYVRALEEDKGFWSDPYYYYDGTGISGHYTTFVAPVHDANGQLACVCGADITFEWLTRQMKQIDESYRKHPVLSDHRMMRNLDFYSVVIDKDGSTIVHPDNKDKPLIDEEVLAEMQKNQWGTMNLTVNGDPARLYYGPVEGLDWTLIIVTSRHDNMKPTLAIGMALLIVAVLSILAVWGICRTENHDEKN
jgi:hypothetical protein